VQTGLGARERRQEAVLLEPDDAAVVMGDELLDEGAVIASAAAAASAMSLSISVTAPSGELRWPIVGAIGPSTDAMTSIDVSCIRSSTSNLLPHRNDPSIP
jgi:hypothetical protein